MLKIQKAETGPTEALSKSQAFNRRQLREQRKTEAENWKV
jgi:hypothetical protein